MKKMKSGIMALMRRVMITCEQASLLATREEYEKLNTKEKLLLSIHLAECNGCKNFHRQMRLISSSIQQNIRISEGKVPLHRLSNTEKTQMERLIQNKIKTK